MAIAEVIQMWYTLFTLEYQHVKFWSFGLL